MERLFCIKLCMCITFHISLVIKEILRAFLFTVGEILSLRLRTPFKSLLLERRDYEEHGEIESLQS
jgi:hypothetical protein